MFDLKIVGGRLIVNGRVVLDGGEHTGALPGRVLTPPGRRTR